MRTGKFIRLHPRKLVDYFEVFFETKDTHTFDLPRILSPVPQQMSTYWITAFTHKFIHIKIMYCVFI